MDAFAVSIVAGLTLPRLTGRHVFRLAFHFGLFQFFMPVLGWLAGQTVTGYVATSGHWVAFGLLALVGGKMVWESRSAGGPAARKDPTRGWSLVALSTATSLDALAVGLSMALIDVSIWLPSVVIGLVAGAMTWIGIVFGSRLGKAYSRRAELVGGLVLIAIGLRVLIASLLK